MSCALRNSHQQATAVLLDGRPRAAAHCAALEPAHRYTGKIMTRHSAIADRLPQADLRGMRTPGGEVTPSGFPREVQRLY